MINYKNVIIKEQTNFQDQIFNEIYLKILDVKMESLNSLTVEVIISVYKSKEISSSNPDWKIKTNEIGNIFLPLFIGDAITPETIAFGIKETLLSRFPEWKDENIIIEESVIE